MTAEEKYRMHESLVVTLCVVLHFSFISPSLCIVMWGPSEPGLTQAMVHGAPWSEPSSAGCRAWLSLGRDASGDTVM